MIRAYLCTGCNINPKVYLISLEPTNFNGSNASFIYYSRVVDADPPSAIVVPTKGSSFSRELRDGDISWFDFLGRAKNSEYVMPLLDISYFLIFHPFTFDNFHLSYLGNG